MKTVTRTVLQVVQHLRPGGIETLCLDLTSFADPDENVLIVSLEGDLESALSTWPRLQAFKSQLIFLKKSPGIRLSVIKQLMQIMKRHQVQVVHTHHIGPLLYAGLAARLIGIKKIIHTEHDAWHLSDQKRRNLQKIVLKVVRPTLVADTQSVAENMRHYLLYKGPINIIQNGIDSEFFTPGNRFIARAKLILDDRVPLTNYSLFKDITLIGCSGRLEQVKGQDVLITALSLLPHNVHLAIAGSGSMKSALRELSQQLNLTERVHFLGHIDDMPTFYRALDLFCLPSLKEGFPLAPLEAQSCNIVSLVTDVGGAKDTLCPKTGQYVIANNSKKMASALLKMIDKSNKYSPRCHIQKNADVRVMAQAYANLRQPVNAIQGEYNG
jgi:glycosyltransferase involved in cell wall biosynthesis